MARDLRLRGNSKGLDSAGNQRRRAHSSLGVSAVVQNYGKGGARRSVDSNPVGHGLRDCRSLRPLTRIHSFAVLLPVANSASVHDVAIAF